MRKSAAFFYAVLIFLFCGNKFLYSQRVGIGTTQFTPSSTLDVKGNVTIGSNYSGVTAAPANGLVVEGSVAIGTTSAQNKLEVNGINSSIGVGGLLGANQNTGFHFIGYGYQH